MNDNERDNELKIFEDSLPAGLPDPPKYLVELAREKKKHEEIRGMRFQKDVDKHLAITLEAYKKCLADVDKMHMKSIIELKSLSQKTENL